MKFNCCCKLSPVTCQGSLQLTEMDHSPGLAMHFKTCSIFLINERKKKNLTHAHQLENKTNKKKSNTHTNTRTTSIRPQPFPQNTISCRTPPQKPRNIVHDTEQLNSQSCDAPSRKLKNQKKKGKKKNNNYQGGRGRKSHF